MNPYSSFLAALRKACSNSRNKRLPESSPQGESRVALITQCGGSQNLCRQMFELMGIVGHEHLEAKVLRTTDKEHILIHFDCITLVPWLGTAPAAPHPGFIIAMNHRIIER